MTARDTSRRYCHGSEHYRGDDEYIWYVPKGENPEKDSRCSYCYKTGVVNDLNCSLYIRDACIVGISCDSEKDKERTTVSFHGMEVSIQALDVPYEDRGIASRPLYLLPESKEKVKVGLGVYQVSTQTKYQVVIRQTPGISSSNCFTLKAKVGNTDVVINNNENIYYYGSAYINGMKTGTQESFLFTSPTESQKASGDVPEHLNESNKIWLTITRYKKQEKPPMWINASQETIRKSLFGGPSNTYGTGEAVKKGGGASLFDDKEKRLESSIKKGCDGGRTVFAHGSSNTFGFFGGGDNTNKGKESNSSSTPFCLDSDFGEIEESEDKVSKPFFGGEGSHAEKTTQSLGYSNNMLSSMMSVNKPTGGSTISGGSIVNRVQTTKSNDKYDFLEEVNISLQLVCIQSDVEKTIDNANYSLKEVISKKNLYAEKHIRLQSLKDNYLAFFNSLKSEADELTTLIKTKEKEIIQLKNAGEDVSHFEFILQNMDVENTQSNTREIQEKAMLNVV